MRLRRAIPFLLLLAAFPVPAADYPSPVERDFIVRDFKFNSGETMAEVRLHYATIGIPRRDSRGGIGNAVLLLHSTGGSLRQFLTEHFADVLFASDGMFDSSHYYIIILDNIGHGRSSKPSDGLHARFPHYDYGDMVELQHRLVTEKLGVQHLYVVLGASMGAMHTWMWGERFPDMMDALVPLASLPTQISGRNRVWRKMIIDDIRTDPEWNGGEYKQQPRGLVAATQILMLVGSAPLQWQTEAPTRDDADRWLDQQMKTRLAATDANDLLYAVEASRDYDPSTQLQTIKAPLLAINSADDFVNPPELTIMDTLMKRVKNGRYVIIPTSDKTRGHGTHSWPVVWQNELARFLGNLNAGPMPEPPK